MASETEREFELVLGNRQLFSVLFLVIVLLAVFFAMGYVMGRQSAPAEALARITPSARTEPTPKQSAATGEVRRSEQAQAQAPQTEAPAKAAPVPAAPPEASKPIEVAPIMVTDPQPGQTYWQLTAATKPVAEVVFEAASKKGFRALITPGPSEKIFRVLVGPAKDAAELSKLRADLEQAGFKPFLRKY